MEHHCTLDMYLLTTNGYFQLHANFLTSWNNEICSNPGDSRLGYLLLVSLVIGVLQAPGRTCMYLGLQGVGKCVVLHTLNQTHGNSREGRWV